MAERDIQAFLDYVFPGDAAPAPRRNSKKVQGDIDDGALEILRAVECQTGVPMNYLERAAGRVLQGLSGLRCLWFLHGLEGQVEMPGQRDRLTVEPDWVIPAIKKWMGSIGTGRGRYEASAWTHDWEAGLAEYTQWDNKTGRNRRVTIRLGKLFKDVGLATEYIKAFETRKKQGQAYWTWKISANPFDVLTMSFGRSWTSCMSPGGLAEMGPLTDMAAGAACLFWYRPGAMEPCGRVILRPFIGRGGVCSINVAPSVKGCASEVFTATEFADELERIISKDLGADVAVTVVSQCQLGTDGKGLSRGIYDDYSRKKCAQSDDDYDGAYQGLAELPWPEPNLADIDLRAMITPEMVESIGGEHVGEIPSPEEVVTEMYPDIENYDLGTLARLHNDHDHSDSVPEQFRDVTEYIDWDAVDVVVKRMTEEEFISTLRYAMGHDYIVLVPVPHRGQLSFKFGKDTQEIIDSWLDYIREHDLESGENTPVIPLDGSWGSHIPQQESNIQTKVVSMLRSRGFDLGEKWLVALHTWEGLDKAVMRALPDIGGYFFAEEDQTYEDMVEDYLDNYTQDEIDRSVIIVQIERGTIEPEDWAERVLY